jgi:predicted enzyme related to lactoylglutathione lyase
MKTPDGMNMPPFWSMYIAVPKLEEAIAHIKRLGGSELSGIIEVPTVGRMEMVKDPQGAAFYIIEPEPRGERPETAPEIGEASWHELMTTDMDAAMTFYQDVFGWKPSESMDIRPPERDDRRHDEQVAGNGGRAAELGHLFPRARRRCRSGAHHSQRRPDPQRPDGSPGWRSHSERHGSARGGVLAAR